MIGTAEMVEVRNGETPEKTREFMYKEMRRDLGEWMDAKEDLVRRPAIELTDEDGEFAARAMVSGINPKEIEVMVTPERLLIKGSRLMRSIEYPRPVNPYKVRAEITNGILCIRARIAGAGKVIDFKARAA